VNWIKIKIWFLGNKLEGSLAIFFLISTLVLGCLVWVAWSDFDTASSEYITKSSELASLSRKKPFPDPANLSTLRDTLGRDQADLDKLDGELQRYHIQPFGNLEKNKPQDRPQQFQDALREEVTKIKTLATTTGSTLPPTFYLGLDEFENMPPLPEQALILAKQLTVLDWVAGSLLNHDGVVVAEFSRPVTESPVKKDGFPSNTSNSPKKPGSSAPAQKNIPDTTPYSSVGNANLVFSCSQTALREFVNTIASPSAPYFVVIESLQLQNTAKEAPKKNAPTEATKQRVGKEHAPLRIPIIVGRENLNVSMKIHILEFPGPNASQSTASPAK
jgi:hypothetical protein